MQQFNYVSIDRIMSKLYTETKDSDINEIDVIGWIGEALEFLKVDGLNEQAVAFIEVKDYEASLPCGFQSVLQIAKNNNNNDVSTYTICPTEVTEETTDTASVPVPLDCNGQPITDYEVAYYRPYFDLKWEYQGWTNCNYYKRNYTPVRLADNTFFKSLVCKERNTEGIYNSAFEEYTIVGTVNRRLRFSFQEGSIALAFVKSVIDRKTGYPLIPDQISFVTAITYYVKWKIAETSAWQGREGFVGLAASAEQRWLKYARQAKNWAKMPKTIDDYQDLLEQSHYLIPNHKRYYGFFGHLNKPENRRFNNPDRYWNYEHQ